VLVRRCLEKNRRARVQSAGDLRVELLESLHPPAAVAPAFGALRAPPRRSFGLNVWTALLGAGVLLAGIAIGRVLSPTPAPASPAPAALRVPVALPPGVEIPYGFTPRLAISPDGRRIAYVGSDERGTSIYVQNLHVSGSAVAIEGTAGALTPFEVDNPSLVLVELRS
jgi:hypothetical protein